MCDRSGSTQKRSTRNCLSQSFGFTFKVATVKPVDDLIIEPVATAKSLLNSKVVAIGNIFNSLSPQFVHTSFRRILLNRTDLGQASEKFCLRREEAVAKIVQSGANFLPSLATIIQCCRQFAILKYRP